MVTSGGPLGDRAPAIAPGSRPSRRTVQLYWKGTGAPQPGAQVIRIYDLAGRTRRVFVLGNESEGVTTWDGRDDHANLVPAGLYFARLTTGSFHVQTRVVLLP